MNHLQHDIDFWQTFDRLIQECPIIIDRPKNTRHPRYPDFVYPVDYGYLADTASMDGNGIDIWVGSESKPMLDAIICTVDILKKDSEVKLLYGCNELEKALIYQIHNSKHMKGILIGRENR